MKKKLNIDKSKNIMVAVSGGRSSAYMAYHIHTSPKYADCQKLYTFANTGQEHPKTIEFLKNIEKHWGIDLIKIEGMYSEVMGVGVKYKIVDYDNLDMDSAPFSGAIMHMNKGVFSGLPSKDAPYCSERLKTRPCEKLANDVFGVGNYVKAIGYRKEDMPKRITWSEVRADENRIFPLLTDFEHPVSLYDLDVFFRSQPFKLDIPKHLGNCVLCWKKSDDNLAKAIADESGKKFIEWWSTMEKTYGNVSFRGNKSIHNLVQLSIQLQSMPKQQLLEIQIDDEDNSCVCSM
jgi:hypothetical protein